MLEREPRAMAVAQFDRLRLRRRARSSMRGEIAFWQRNRVIIKERNSGVCAEGGYIKAAGYKCRYVMLKGRKQSAVRLAKPGLPLIGQVRIAAIFVMADGTA